MIFLHASLFSNYMLVLVSVSLLAALASLLVRPKRLAEYKPLKLKLVVDEKKNRVMYAEADKEFVEVLFSCLLLPMGMIIRLANKRSEIGCMDELFSSVEKLDEECLNTRACREMLLNPRSAYEVHCRNLTIKMDKREPSCYYICSKWYCSAYSVNYRPIQLASMIKNAECSCGRLMDREIFMNFLSSSDDRKDVILNKTKSFLITDDLQIRTLSLSKSVNFYKENGVEDFSTTKVKHVDIGVKEVPPDLAILEYKLFRVESHN